MRKPTAAALREWTIPTPLGPLRLRASADGAALERIDYAGGPASRRRERSPALRRAAEQLAAYFAGRLRAFDLPLSPEGTPFQRAVWDEIARTGFGRTRSYQDVAVAMGLSARAARAVGQATGRNPLSIVVPCHRIVGAGGALVGYGGGLENKRRLLALEAGR